MAENGTAGAAAAAAKAAGGRGVSGVLIGGMLLPALAQPQGLPAQQVAAGGTCCQQPDYRSSHHPHTVTALSD